jgi:hypothetical protein
LCRRLELALSIDFELALDKLKRAGRTGGLLHDVGCLVRHQPRVVWRFARPQPDVLSVREGAGLQRPRRGVGSPVTVHTDSAKIYAGAHLHPLLERRVERLTTAMLMHGLRDSTRVHRRATTVPGDAGFGLHRCLDRAYVSILLC